MPRILIVDDEPGIRQSLKGVFEDEGFTTEAVATGEECLEKFAEDTYDLVLLDIWLPGADGLETLRKLRQKSPATHIIMISGHATIATAVTATKLGAYDFIEKPLSLEHILLIARNALSHRRLEQANDLLRHQLEERFNIVGESIPVKALRKQIAIVAPTNSRVLIYGESGTGKELVSRITATNKNLQTEIAAGRFREDLFYRLNVIPFVVPPLRERREDIPVLARYFMRVFSAEHGRGPKEFSSEALDLLVDYSWPGNVRELRNEIERLVIMVQDGAIQARDLSLPNGTHAARASTLHEARAQYEREFIISKLKENNWNVSQTARLLGLERSYLYRKMKTYGIEK